MRLALLILLIAVQAHATRPTPRFGWTPSPTVAPTASLSPLPTATPTPTPSPGPGPTPTREPGGLTTWFNGLGLLINFGIGLINLFTLFALRRQLRLTGDALKATQESAHAATKAASAPMALERPWLIIGIDRPFLSPAQGSGVMPGQLRVEVPYTLTNYGRTPTWVTAFRFSIIPLGGGPAPEGETPRDHVTGIRDWFKTEFPPIAPGASGDPGTMIDHPLFEARHRQKDSLRAMVFGAVDYLDVFGETHTAGFAWDIFWIPRTKSEPLPPPPSSRLEASVVRRGPKSYWGEPHLS